MIELYDFRFGKNPFHKKQLTDEQKKVKADCTSSNECGQRIDLS